MGEKQSKQIINNYVQNTSENIESNEEKNILSMYMYQILLREGTTEYGIINMFNGDLQAYLPLGGSEKLGSPSFPLAISFFYGDLDWMLEIEDPAATLVLE